MMQEIDVHTLAMALAKGMTARLMLKWDSESLSPRDFFSMEASDVASALGITSRHSLASVRREELLERAEHELTFMGHHNVRAYICTDRDYPYRLLQNYSAPPVLFTYGNGPLQSEHVVSVVGTRRPTAYGLKWCESIVEECCRQCGDIQVVSGLAYGVDACAHNAALAAGRETVAVVAHGLDMVYPAAHRQLAYDIASRGGLIVTQYPSKTQPFRNNFLARNQIIASLADATIVVESGIRGGALSTANAAFDLDREVFAIPGRIGDEMSEGCNNLIRKNKASIITGADTVVKAMGWHSADTDTATPQQAQLFPELSDEQMPVYNILKASDEPMSPDAIHIASGMNIAAVMSVLGDMELDGIAVRLPGNRYSLA